MNTLITLPTDLALASGQIWPTSHFQPEDGARCLVHDANGLYMNVVYRYILAEKEFFTLLHEDVALSDTTAFQVVGPGPRVSLPLIKERAELLLRGYGLELDKAWTHAAYCNHPDGHIIDVVYARPWDPYGHVETIWRDANGKHRDTYRTVGTLSQALFDHLGNPTGVRKEGSNG